MYLQPGRVRKARKEHACTGNGAASPEHAKDCPRVIEPGERYYEYEGEAHAFESGSRHSLACAEAFYKES